MYFKTPIAHQVPTMIKTLTNNFMKGSDIADYRLTSLSFDRPSFGEPDSVIISFTYYKDIDEDTRIYKICKFKVVPRLDEEEAHYRIYPMGKLDDDQWEMPAEFLNGLVDLEVVVCSETIKPKYKH